MRRAALGVGCLLLALLGSVMSATVSPGVEPSKPDAPSSKVVAFYYGWYGNPRFDGRWIHWSDEVNRATPPADLPSDYYPTLSAYSSRDPAVRRQHMDSGPAART